MKGSWIQDNLHFVYKILKGWEDSTEATLINLDYFKAFDSIDHWFLANVLETAGFKPFHKCKSMMRHNPQAVLQMNSSKEGGWEVLTDSRDQDQLW